jgi:iron complex transport system ATP-binding protein
VLVTHHVEEITPGFTHALLLRDGHILTQGPRHQTLTSSHLSQLFNHPVTVRRHQNRLQLTLTPQISALQTETVRENKYCQTC